MRIELHATYGDVLSEYRFWYQSGDRITEIVAAYPDFTAGVYKGEVVVAGERYEFEIDAFTGEVLEWKVGEDG